MEKDDMSLFQSSIIEYKVFKDFCDFGKNFKKQNFLRINSF